ncbi:DUF3151 domain-containing protein [Helcobacillus massiliensis]|uniref:DUF3151 domain-containing protein n=1 Tax=Helcobacillus massiliensis TaxID=521392 RepID=A0A839QRF7_9MICO|nr:MULTISPECIES: DUF3151 domain-containing protein [Helcobacillus]MBB3023053.1 hypothetical protein [Helcobacillus massiliensis]MCG7426066.1 DUF3151 domain-containing protein [Helcobacillus sp. ACRRO]MCT1558366.1 DUF3151 domain-containing protein [Helcobacillus massiliensis]MCT2036862.1 DUF3151 domain-containing protein [Helcobacillus massiliensis]MCT2332643.1 DUF3151 domain-containing protein [Helcobacillus massiliensis]
MSSDNDLKLSAPKPELGGNLLGPEPTLLPEDGPDEAVSQAFGEGRDLRAIAAEHPTSSLAWAMLADESMLDGDVVAAYAFARVGYHRGLDALRRAGWRGQGPVPADHAPNRGFLQCLVILGRAAEMIGEDDEVARINDFIRDCDPSLVAPAEGGCCGGACCS